ncbi:MAG: TolC family protein [Planctomycetaceae bacterium]
MAQTADHAREAAVVADGSSARAAAVARTAPLAGQTRSNAPRNSLEALRQRFRGFQSPIQHVAFQEEQPAAEERFRIPAEIPGANTPPLNVPQLGAELGFEQRREALGQVYPKLDAPASPVDAAEVATRSSVSLLELQSMALQHSPVLRQAAADVEQARGLAIQAGLHPNPIIGYEGDSLGTAKTAGYNGVYFNQEIVTAGKLGYAKNAALMEMQAAQANLRKARITLATEVRRRYFDVLIAEERLKLQRAIAELADEVYSAQIDLVASLNAAAYEPLQLRVSAVQARNNVVEAENQLAASWRRLAAAVGVPSMSRQPVSGSVEMSIPYVDYNSAAAYVSTYHSDLSARQALIGRASHNLCRQRVEPYPNLQVYSALQHDDTTNLNSFAANVQVGVEVPLFDRNQGNITAANAELVRAHQDLADTRNQLLGQLAEAHGRYSASQQIVKNYRDDILRDQVLVYRGVQERFRVWGEAGDFSEIVIAQQSLASAVDGYLSALNAQWQAAVDLAELIQADDMLQMGVLIGSEVPLGAPPTVPAVDEPVPVEPMRAESMQAAPMRAEPMPAEQLPPPVER